MTSHSHSDHSIMHGTDQHGHGGIGKYLMVFVALCVLTAISFAVGNSANLRNNAPAIMMAMMMAVSCAKAMLVIMFFMHLKWEANWKYVLTVPASIMSIFLMLMLVPDIGRRTNRYSEERWLHAAEVNVHAAEHAPHADGDHGQGGHGSDVHGTEGKNSLAAPGPAIDDGKSPVRDAHGDAKPAHP